jgi:hypothetical protein
LRRNLLVRGAAVGAVTTERQIRSKSADIFLTFWPFCL